MEVHSHTHTSLDPDSHRGRKKWTHYLWEFLMLFLAVFCGFLAEYQLEHMIEKDREKQFIQSLVSDLKDDTLRIAAQINEIKEHTILFDSLCRFLDSPELARKNGDAIYYASRKGPRTGPLVNNSRTFDQLTNSGGFRLINKSETSNRIMDYYSQLPQLRMLEGIFNVENAAYKSVASRIIDPAIYRRQENPDGSVARVTGNPALLSYDAASLKQLEFQAVQMNGTRRGMMNLLRTLKQSAEELLNYLQDSYHLE